MVAVRNSRTHRGFFVLRERLAEGRVIHTDVPYETKEFNLTSDWRELCAYFDGWTATDLSAAAQIRGRIFEKFQTSALGLVLFDHEQLD